MRSDANLEILPVPTGLASETVPPNPELGGSLRQLLHSSGIYALASFSVKTLNFLLIALYSRFLLPADYGIVSLSEVSAMLVSTVTGLGLSAAIVRFYFEHGDDPRRQKSFISTLLRFCVTATVIGLALMLIAGALAPGFFLKQVKVAFFPYLALALAAAAATQIVDFRSGLYQSQQLPKRFARLSLLSFLFINLGVMVFVIAYRMGATGLLLGKFAGAVCMACVALWLLRPWWNAGWEPKDIAESLRFGLPLVPHQILALGLVIADRFILSRYRDLTEVGIYSLAYTLGMVMYMFTSAVSLAWNPMFYDLARQGERGRSDISNVLQHLIPLLTLVACFGILIAQPFTTWFLDARYAMAGRLVPWIIASYFFHALTSLSQTPLLQAKRTSALALVTAMAFALNIVLNLAWIPRWGMYGAAYATLTAYVVQTLMTHALAQSAFRLSYGGVKLVLWMGLLGAMLFVSQSDLAAQPNLMLPMRLIVSTVAIFAARHLWAEGPLAQCKLW